MRKFDTFRLGPLPRFAVLAALIFSSFLAPATRAEDNIPALFKERVKSVVAVEFFIQNELDRQPVTVDAFVTDADGTLALPPGAVDNRVQPSQLKDFRVYLPGRPPADYAHGTYLGQDPLSGWNFVHVEPGALRSQLVPVTAFAAKSELPEPAMGEDYWGIGLRTKDEDFAPYFLTGKIAMVKSLPDRTAIALSEVAAPGLPVFDGSGSLAGIALGGYGSTYLEFSHKDRALPILLINVEESRIFQLISAVRPWMSRVPATVDSRPIAWLGAYGLQPMDPDVAAFMKLGNQSGCVVSEVLPDSPALAAGMKDHDIIVAIDGKPVPRFAPDAAAITYIERTIIGHKPGDKLPVTVLRDGKSIDLIATLIDQPKLQREATRQYFSRLGLTAREFVYGDGVLLRVKPADQRGVIVNFVKNNSPADAAGLRPGDWVQEVDGTEVKTYAEAIAKLAAIEADKTRADFVLLVSRDNATSVLRVKLN